MFKNWSDRTCLASPGIPVLRSFLTSPGANLLIISPCIQWFLKIFVQKIISSILGLIEFYPFFEFKRKLRSMKSTFFFIFFLFSINSIAQTMDSTVVNFEFGKYYLDPFAQGKIDRFLMGDSIVRIRISAHCDSFGSNAYNATLSLKRAREVQQFLLNRNFRTIPIEILAKGEDAHLLQTHF